MVTPTYPGVYVEEVSSGVRPITAASTSTAAFIGQADRGSLTEAVRIFNFTEFQNLYGGFRTDSYLAHAVYQFFNNGGSICYIVRVGQDVDTADIELNDRGGAPQVSMTVEAASAGVWGNDIELVISNGTANPGNEFNMEVYLEGETSPVETYENLSMVPSSPRYVETATANSDYISVSVNEGNTNVTAGTSLGSAAPTVPLPSGRTLMQINVNGDGLQSLDLQDAVTAGDVADLNSAANVATAIQSLVQALTPLRGSTDATAFTGFTAVVDAGGELLLTSGAAGSSSSVSVSPATDSSRYASALLNLGILEGGVETVGAAVTRPVANDPAGATAPVRYLVGDHGLPATGVNAVHAGSDGVTIDNDQPYIQALQRLNSVNDVSLIAAPGVGSATMVGEGMNYCANRSLSDCFFIGDVASNIDEVDEAQTFVGNISPKNSYGAVYMPWVLMLDPTGASSEPIAAPPSGFVAGLYAKTDSQRGVWKAPAGTAAAIGGSTGLTVNLTDTQQGLLNPDPYNVNVLRQFAASGRVIWGSRTISSDAEWRYVPVRRTAIMLRVSIYRGIQWAVFEPNDEELWSQLRLNISAFMMTLYRRGAFQGSSPDQAFFVKCDAETNPQADIDNGIVNVLVGFAPLKPAEFVIVKISQKAGQSG